MRDINLTIDKRGQRAYVVYHDNSQMQAAYELLDRSAPQDLTRRKNFEWHFMPHCHVTGDVFIDNMIYVSWATK